MRGEQLTTARTTRGRKARGDLQHTSEEEGLDEVRVGTGCQRPDAIVVERMAGDDENLHAPERGLPPSGAHETRFDTGREIELGDDERDLRMQRGANGASTVGGFTNVEAESLESRAPLSAEPSIRLGE